WLLASRRPSGRVLCPTVPLPWLPPLGLRSSSIARSLETNERPTPRPPAATVYAPTPARGCAASHSHDARGGPANPDGTRKFLRLRQVYVGTASLVCLGTTGGRGGGLREISGFPSGLRERLEP